MIHRFPENLNLCPEVAPSGFMKLIKAQVTNFRSVEDSGEFDIDQVTSLVGKNEAGKSALLLAITALNP